MFYPVDIFVKHLSVDERGAIETTCRELEKMQ
jgi:hypothetical protein